MPSPGVRSPARKKVRNRRKGKGKAKAKAKAKAAPLPPRPVVQVAPMSRRGRRAAHEAHAAAKVQVFSQTLLARTKYRHSGLVESRRRPLPVKLAFLK